VDFISDTPGETLLNLVARGSAIVAELLRLSDHIPAVFVGSVQKDTEKYQRLLFDFQYLKHAELLDEKIDSNAVREREGEREKQTENVCVCRF